MVLPVRTLVLLVFLITTDVLEWEKSDRRSDLLDVFQTQLVMLRLCPVHCAPVVLQFGLLVIELLREFNLADDSLAARR